MASTFNPPITPTAHGRPWDQSCGLLLRLEKVVVVGHSFGKAGLQARRMFLVRAWEAIPARGGRRTRPVCGKSRSSRCWTQRRVAFIALFPSFCNTPDSILLAAKLGDYVLTYNVIFETKLFLRLTLTYRLSAQRRIPACGAIWAPFNTGH